MSKTIAIMNHKGGVGKTTSVASLGAALSAMGKRVLLVDLDAQSNLTSSLYSGRPTATIYTALTERVALPILELKENLHLTPSALEMAGVELELANAKGRESILRDLLTPVADRYDYIIIDCPPSLGLISVNAILAASEIYVPMTAEALPYKGLEMINYFLDMARQTLNKDTEISGIIITRYAGRNLNKLVAEDIRAHYGDKVFQTMIRENITIAEAPLAQEDIFSYSPKSNAATDYQKLAEEIVARENK